MMEEYTMNGVVKVKAYHKGAHLQYTILPVDGKQGEITLFNDGRFAFNNINGSAERWYIYEKMIDEFLFLRGKVQERRSDG